MTKTTILHDYNEMKTGDKIVYTRKDGSKERYIVGKFHGEIAELYLITQFGCISKQMFDADLISREEESEHPTMKSPKGVVRI